MRISDWSSDVCSSDLGDDRGGRGIFAVQSFDLIGIENRVSFQERNGALVVRLGVFHDKLVGIDNGGSLAALPDIAAQLQRLLEGQPIGRGDALTHSAGPKAEYVDQTIGRSDARGEGKVMLSTGRSRGAGD